MDSQNLKKHLNSISMKQIKISIRQYELDQLQQLWKSNMKTFLKDVDGDYDELLLHPVALRIKELRQLL